MNEPALIDRLLSTPGHWAVVGCSPRPARDSHRIARLLRDEGHRITPVNPNVEGTVLDVPVVASLEDIDDPIDVVDVFRRPSAAGDAVDAAIATGAGAVWLQLGVIDHDAAARAEAAGLGVVMDRCPAIELRSRG
jgi:predicted CoA-binding protein